MKKHINKFIVGALILSNIFTIGLVMNSNTVEATSTKKNIYSDNNHTFTLYKQENVSNMTGTFYVLQDEYYNKQYIVLNTGSGVTMHERLK